MMMTMIIATIPYVSVVFEAKPLGGDAVGAGEAAAFSTVKDVSAED